MKGRKLHWKEKLLLVSPLLLLALPAVSFLRHELNQDAMDKAMQKLAGPHAIDCGICEVSKTGAVGQCALAARSAGKPFFCRVRYGSIYSEGFVMTSQGQLYVMGHSRGRWGGDGHIFEILRAKSFTPDMNRIFDVKVRVPLSNAERAATLGNQFTAAEPSAATDALQSARSSLPFARR